jgi:ankyrin repeat protein
MKKSLWKLLSSILTRNSLVNKLQHISWSMEGYSTVVRIAKSILSNWCIDKHWIDRHDDEDGCTILLLAGEHGHTSVVELLLADPRVDKSSIDHTNAYGGTALVCAASNGNISVVTLLLADTRVDKASIDHTTEDGWTALSSAASDGHTSVVELLLADPRVDKASIDHASEDGWTALMCAASNGS